MCAKESAASRRSSDNAKKSEPNDSDRRRDYIIQSVRRAGVVTIQEIKGAGHSAHPQSLSSDQEFFEVKHPAIGIQKTDGGFRQVRPNEKTLYEERQEARQPAKIAIGRLAAHLICAGRGWAECLQAELSAHAEHLKRLTAIDQENLQVKKREKGVLAKLKSISGSREALQALREFPAAERPLDHQRVYKFFEQFHCKKTRHIILDSGTTTEQIAIALAELAPYGHCNVTAITNASRIEDQLGMPEVPVKVIGIGGELRKDTRARTGHLNELCLKAWSHVRPDIAFIGATNIRYAFGVPAAFACDSDEEARTKALMLDSELRCLVMDSAKFDMSVSSSFMFCPASRDHVDLILTDDGIAEGHPTVRFLEGQGIAVLRAPVNGAEDTSAIVRQRA
jgi:DeoR/GlpR family transcriptional regulator of sugar metabolism